MKQISHKRLLGLILLMFLLATTNNAVGYWYLDWRAYIQHGDTSDDTLSSLFEEDWTPTLSAISSLGVFLGVARLGIADSIMVIESFCSTLCKHH
jgi:hypothetical protein